MQTTTNGIMPGADTPIEKAPGAANAKGLHNYTNSADYRSHGAATGIGGDKKLTAIYARLTGAIGSIDLALALMAAQFALIVWGAF